MVLKKTCWYTIISPMTPGRPDRQARHLYPEFETLIRFGFFVGTAFQIRDDVLNLIGRRSATARRSTTTSLEGKRTLMLIHLLSNATAQEHERIAAFLASPREERSESRCAGWWSG